MDFMCPYMGLFERVVTSIKIYELTIGSKRIEPRYNNNV